MCSKIRFSFWGPFSELQVVRRLLGTLTKFWIWSWRSRPPCSVFTKDSEAFYCCFRIEPRDGQNPEVIQPWLRRYVGDCLIDLVRVANGSPLERPLLLLPIAVPQSSHCRPECKKTVLWCWTDIPLTYPYHTKKQDKSHHKKSLQETGSSSFFVLQFACFKHGSKLKTQCLVVVIWFHLLNINW